VTALQDICLLITDGKHGDCQDENGSGYYFVSCKDVRDGCIDYSDARQITEADYLDTDRRTQLEANDIVVTNSGTIGRMALVPNVPETKRTTFQKSVAILKPIQEKVVPHWLYYSLMANREALISWAGGTAQKNLLLRDMRAFDVEVPPLPTQRKIAVILSAYDDLIENNLQRIKILEEMAQNLYREWFVKFRFPDHQHAHFTNSPLGRIPEGWEVTEFRNLFEIKYGKTLPKTKIADVGPYPVYGAGDVIGYYDEVLYREKCTLVTSRGNGSGTVWRTREAAFVTNNSLIILPRIEFKHWDYSFVELLLKHSNVMEAKTGSAQPQVTIENLNYVKAIVPQKPCVERFCSFATPISEQVDLYLSKNATLRRMRDLLLPRLISGEVDLSALDIAVPEEGVA